MRLFKQFGEGYPSKSIRVRVATKCTLKCLSCSTQLLSIGSRVRTTVGMFEIKVIAQCPMENRAVQGDRQRRLRAMTKVMAKSAGCTVWGLSVCRMFPPVAAKNPILPDRILQSRRHRELRSTSAPTSNKIKAIKGRISWRRLSGRERKYGDVFFVLVLVLRRRPRFFSCRVSSRTSQHTSQYLRPCVLRELA